MAAFIGDLLTRYKPATAGNRYRAMNSFFKWCMEEGEIKRSPMERTKPPHVPVEAPEVIKPEDMKRLLKACSGERVRGTS
ncbi:MAG TPA: hypothetical protein VF914_12005 [Chloroflexia bacterium]